MENDKTITYRIKFIDSVRFMSMSLLSLTDYLSKGLHINKCKNCRSGLEYRTAKNSTLAFKCVGCNKSCQKKFDENLAKRFPNTYKFCDGDNKFCLMLRKGIYHEYMNSWQRFNETFLPDKKEFYSSLTMQDDNVEEFWKISEYKT